jgi:hypothetical protein
LPKPNLCSILDGVTIAPASLLDDRSHDRLALTSSLRSGRVTLAGEQVLPVLPALGALLPGGALARGTTVAVLPGPGATSLALALTAGAAQAGSWVAVVGGPPIGWAAAWEVGLPFERVVVVDEPPAERWSTVVAALVGAVDIVLVAPTHRVPVGDARRLAARQRERGTVLVHLESGAARRSIDADVRLAVETSSWVGIGAGHGHLQGRQARVLATGRRQASRPRHVDLWLPAPGGGVEPVDTLAEVVELGPVDEASA